MDNLPVTEQRIANYFLSPYKGDGSPNKTTRQMLNSWRLQDFEVFLFVNYPELSNSKIRELAGDFFSYIQSVKGL